MAAHAVGDAKGWEYIVQETPDDKLVSVTQTSRTPLAVGLHVLVIAGAQQARIVPDYTVEIAAAAPAKAAAADADKTVPAGNGTAALEINISPVLPAAGAAGGAPVTVASDPAPAPGAASGDAVAAPKPAPTLAGGAVTDGSTGGEGSALATASAGAAPNAGQVAPAAAAATPMVTPAGVTSH
jgi:hypothetical protein